MQGFYNRNPESFKERGINKQASKLVENGQIFVGDIAQQSNLLSHSIFPDIIFYYFCIRGSFSDSYQPDVFIQFMQGFYNKQQVLSFLDTAYI